MDGQCGRTIAGPMGQGDMSGRMHITRDELSRRSTTAPSSEVSSGWRHSGASLRKAHSTAVVGTVLRVPALPGSRRVGEAVSQTERLIPRSTEGAVPVTGAVSAGAAVASKFSRGRFFSCGHRGKKRTVLALLSAGGRVLFSSPGLLAPADRAWLATARKVVLTDLCRQCV